MPSRQPHRLLRADYRSLLNVLLWVSVMAATFGLEPGAAEAAKKRGLKSEPVKGKTTPPQRPTLAPAKKALLQDIAPPAESLEIRDHVVHRVQPGETLLGILNRFRLPLPEKQLWTRTVKRDVGPATLPAGKEIEFFFTKPSARPRTQPPA